ncbi:restriction endonuclease subunit S [Paenibacillus sp. DMB5]|uniref:restriction endonuclease subunit S n=1 Tax=Paenibacillus sp. DMB5 TaxID=1780103 RepID=UPI00076BEE7E|nr:restriction endonuclease subunit S [Paenibacillus sp. DMB5]KUP21140.1 hypothetical protein AWJ19_08020 [Paenibacillus sp. DMB5]
MTENKQTLIPEIRFKGFTNAWEQRELGEAFSQTSKCVNPKEENVELWSLTVENGLTPKTERYNREFLVKKEDAFKLVLPGDFIYNPMNMTLGAIDLNLTGKEVAVSGYYITMKTNESYDSGYFAVWLKSPIAIKLYKLHATGGLLEKQRVHYSTFVQIKSLIPSVPEQTAIGNFFRTLDDAITLHKRKLDGLRKLKKGYLQLMFPQANERVPRIRFGGFTGEWEERRLGDISLKVSEKNKNNQFTETFTNSAEHGIISQRDFFDKDISNSKNLDGYFIVRPDDFVYNPRISNFAPVGPIKRNTLERTGVMSPLYYVFRVTEGECIYIEKYFESIYWHEFMKTNGDNGVRSDRFNIKDSVFEEMPIPFPSIAEQTVIGNFFCSLDEQITVQAAKLEQLQQLKTAYLKKMFI